MLLFPFLADTDGRSAKGGGPPGISPLELDRPFLEPPTDLLLEGEILFSLGKKKPDISLYGERHSSAA